MTKNAEVIKNKFSIPPISKNANLVSMPNQWYNFFRYVIDNFWGYELEIIVEVKNPTKERVLYDERQK